MKLRLIITFLSIVAITSCDDKTSYKSAKAIVVDTKHRHWGRGYYKLEVFYKYFNGSDTIIGHSTADGMEQSYTSTFSIGDSLLIGFDPIDNDDTYIIKKTYTLDRFEK